MGVRKHLKTAFDMTLLFLAVVGLALWSASTIGVVNITVSITALAILVAMVFAFFLALSYLSARCVCEVR